MYSIRPLSPVSSDGADSDHLFMVSSPTSAKITPSDNDLVDAIASTRREQPALGILKVLDYLRNERDWTISEKRIRKITKDNNFLKLSPPSHTTALLSPPSSPPLQAATPVAVPISPAALTKLNFLPPSGPRSRPPGARGRVRAPKPSTSTAMCFETSTCDHKSHVDAWLPGPLKKIKIHLDYLRSLSPPKSHTFFHAVRLHVMTCEKTGQEYVLAPEVTRSIWSRLDPSIARLAHSFYTPGNSSSLFPSSSNEASSCLISCGHLGFDDSTRLVGCPQGLRHARCTLIGRRGEIERVWVVRNREGEREVRVEFGAECHSENPAKPPALASVVGKGKAKAEPPSMIVRVKESDLVKLDE